MAWGRIVVLGSEETTPSEPIDFELPPNDVLYTLIKDIANSTHNDKYLEPRFADGRGNKGLFEEATDTLIGDSTNRIIGYGPWKAIEVYYKTVE